MLNDLVIEYAKDTENAKKNYNLAIEYERMGQTAAAISFFLRASERTDDKTLAYECLIRVGNCFDKQKNREYTVRSMYNAAIALLPDRPEAYYLLSRFQEWKKEYFESYTTAEMGLNTLKNNKKFNDIGVVYPGKWALLFQKAVAGWWRGRGTESRQLFQYLFDNHFDDMDLSHQTAVKNNIINLGSSPPNYIYRMYDKRDYGKLRYKFPGSRRIWQNYSQIYQDLFVLSMTNGKRNGSFVEIGGAEPTKGNNTYLLEKDFAWGGISVEYNKDLAEAYKKARPTIMYNYDALTLDYASIFRKTFAGDVIDYLQLDIEPAGNTYECLKRIPFDRFKFRVITYEHDYYADFSRTYRQLSRDFLKSKGYVMVVNDASFDGVCTFEDWWVHPDLVDPEILKIMTDVDDNIKDATKYMLCKDEPYVEFDWGLINHNQWFKNVVTNEIFVSDVYQKFVSVKKGDVVLDIGASVGPFSWVIRDSKPSKVICVEPHKELYQTLKRNVDFICVNKAIGHTDGKETQSGLFNENLINTNEEENAQEIETITFQTLLKENDVNHVNFMKLDCEGGEYDVFTDENFDWIKKNVDYIAGEFHLSTDSLRDKFKHFRDNYLSKFSKYDVYSCDGVDIKHSLMTDWFLGYYKEVNIYIDNREKNEVIVLPKKKLKNKWKYSIAPTLEFTTMVPEKGCVVDCVFCPQRTLVKNYKGERRLTLENFKRAVDKLPKEVRVTFSGFMEPWMNSNCTEMVLYAHDTGHPVSVFTTLVGVSIEDLEKIKHIPFAGPPNGGFTVHLPDQERRAKHPINKKYIETVEHLYKIKDQIQNFSIMSMGTIHESVRHIFPTVHVGEMWSRAGNLIGERILKPELKDQNFLSIDHGDKIMTCGCDERLYHNVMMPNGDVSLCCMDYGVEEITGNLFEQDYDDVLPDPYTSFDLCRKCENGISCDSAIIKAERKRYNI